MSGRLPPNSVGKTDSCGGGEGPDVDGLANRFDRSTFSIPTQHR